MVTKLLFAPALAATMAQADLFDKPDNAASAFAFSDLAVGLVAGGYGTLIGRTYARDCFSSVFNLAFDNLSYSQLADTGVETETGW